LGRENAKLDIFQKSSISLGCNVPHGIPYDGTFAIIDSIFFNEIQYNPINIFFLLGAEFWQYERNKNKKGIFYHNILTFFG
jgi:hypothetical protein